MWYLTASTLRVSRSCLSVKAVPMARARMHGTTARCVEHRAISCCARIARTSGSRLPNQLETKAVHRGTSSRLHQVPCRRSVVSLSLINVRLHRKCTLSPLRVLIRASATTKWSVTMFLRTSTCNVTSPMQKPFAALLCVCFLPKIFYVPRNSCTSSANRWWRTPCQLSDELRLPGRHMKLKWRTLLVCLTC